MHKWTKKITEIERLRQSLGLDILVLEKEGHTWYAQVRIRDGAIGQRSWAETKAEALYWAMRSLLLDVDGAYDRMIQQEWLAIAHL